MIITKTKKFKTTIISVRFKEEINKDNVALRALLPSVMSASSPQYNTRRKLNETLKSLYGASISATNYKIGKISIVDFSLSIINPSFLDDGFFLLSLKVLHNIIFGHKNLSKKEFDLEKRLLLEKVTSLNSDKTYFSLNKLFKEMFKGQRYAIRTVPEKEEVLSLTYEKLNDYYKNVLKNNDIDLTITGDINDEEIALIKSYFKPRDNFNHLAIDEEPHYTNELKFIKEEDDIKQAKLNIGYNLPIKFKEPLYNAAMVFNRAFGGSVHSKLFKIVREKHSLCYYIQSNIDFYKGFLYVYTGVDKNKVNKTMELIAKQLKDLQTNPLSLKELNLSKNAIINNLKQTKDSQYGSISQKYLRKLINRKTTIDKRIAEIESVKAADVLKVANLVKIDTIYLLNPEEKSEI